MVCFYTGQTETTLPKNCIKCSKEQFLRALQALEKYEGHVLVGPQTHAFWSAPKGQKTGLTSEKVKNSTTSEVKDVQTSESVTKKVKGTRDETLLGALVRENGKFSLFRSSEEKVRDNLGAVLADQPMSFYRTLLAKDLPKGDVLEAYIMGNYPRRKVSSEDDAQLLSEEVFQWLKENKPQVNGKARGTPDFLPYCCH